VTFGAIIYGNGDKESYGVPAGMRIAKINAVRSRLNIMQFMFKAG